MEKKERRERKILTENRLVTINRRETSFEGLVEHFENGEDGIYNLISDNRQTIFRPKVSITPKDLAEIPPLAALHEAILSQEAQVKSASGHRKYLLKRALIEMRKDQYLIKAAYRKPIAFTKLTRSACPPQIQLNDTTHLFNEKGRPIPEGVSLLNPKVCEAILCNYSRLKQDSWDNFSGDTWYLLQDFERICDIALEPYPLYLRLLECKIDGIPNRKIREILRDEFNVYHTAEYISTLWRRKIPRLIASTAEDLYLDEYFLNTAKGTYKRCSRCGQIKLANNKYFSKNNTSKDGFYSICKKCRNSGQKKINHKKEKSRRNENGRR